MPFSIFPCKNSGSSQAPLLPFQLGTSFASSASTPAFLTRAAVFHSLTRPLDTSLLCVHAHTQRHTVQHPSAISCVRSHGGCTPQLSPLRAEYPHRTPDLIRSTASRAFRPPSDVTLFPNPFTQSCD